MPSNFRSAGRCEAKLYLQGMIHRVGAKGQVVIPKDLRDRVGLYPGTAVDFAVEGERIVLLPLPRQRRTRLGGRFAKSGMAARLLQDRAAEPR
jgi:AbrB family looped-hinge helix DNA binding protein